MNKQQMTQKAVEMIQSGTVEIWSAQLGDLSLGNLKTVAVELNKLGYKTVLLRNSNDNAIKVI